MGGERPAGTVSLNNCRLAFRRFFGYPPGMTHVMLIIKLKSSRIRHCSPKGYIGFRRSHSDRETVAV